MGTTKFTSEERKIIYKEAIEDLLMNGRWSNICSTLSDLLSDRVSDEEYVEHVHSKPYYMYLYEYFPELPKIKPADKLDNQAWWTYGNIDIRIEKLNQMIKLCDNGND